MAEGSSSTESGLGKFIDGPYPNVCGCNVGLPACIPSSGGASGSGKNYSTLNV